ncbi:hypothetical protein THUN1379_25470 [Paludibacterium sp. THUN1379]|uniref:hypothetical protein n=1 Tax=Paludibacterium sp. THUN1379 TaxID=3112107 RepID=UPI00308666FE|nr:hypothetical protein THUN1379_25470 [Paludibacterium sp. THUN1379]
MTIVSPLSTPPATASWPSSYVAPASASGSSDSPSTVVTLGAVADPDVVTYTPSLSPTLPAVVWQRDEHDALSALLAQNFRLSSQKGRFQGLGAAVMQRLGNDTSNDAQSIRLAVPLPVESTALFTRQGSLHVKTVGGGEVMVTLSQQNDRLGVEIVSHNAISDQEREALAGLAQGFQQALDGLSEEPPRLAMTGLLQYDSQLLSAVDFQADLKPSGTAHTRYSFHVDQQTRSLTIEGTAGKVQLNVNTRDLRLWGSQSQQAATVDHYLQQFDQAGQRGHADEELINWLKVGFTQLNHQDSQATETRHPSTLNEDDHALLSGLADFSLAINATPVQPNARRMDEWQTFSYQASQQTEVDDKNPAERQVVQNQQTQLSASFHTAVPGVPLDFKHGDYVYNQIQDSASTRTAFGYHKAQLAYATVEKAASQRTRQQTYLAAQKVSDTTREKPGHLHVDLMPLLSPDHHADQLKTEAERQAEHAQRLIQAHGLIQLPVLSSQLV